MDTQTFLATLYQSMQDSARLARLSLGRPSSRATRQQALEQVAFLQRAREAQQFIDEVGEKATCIDCIAKFV